MKPPDDDARRALTERIDALDESRREALDRVLDAFEDWEGDELAAALDRFGERREAFETSWNAAVDPLYTPLDRVDGGYLEAEGFPGRPPYTRGPYPTMYRGRLWTMREYSGFGTPEETNALQKRLLEAGNTGLSLAFDLPTQIGYDSDAPEAEGEVGRVGVSVDSLRDMEIILDGIPLEDISTNMTINATAPILLAMYVAVAKQRGVALEDLRGTVQNDLLKEFVARGTYIYPPAPSLRLVTDLIEYCAEHVPQWYAISVSGGHYYEAGCDMAQQLAFAISAGIDYVRAARERGLDVDEFAPRLSWQFLIGMRFFENVAMLRAGRRLWADIMREEFGADDPRSQLFRVYTGTQGGSLTRREPMNNIARVAIEVLSGALAGTQAMNAKSYDEAYSIPSERAQRISTRTQQIVAYETDVATTVDPLGGSYYVESLTDELEAEVRRIIEAIQDRGGMAEAIESGYVQGRIDERSYQSFRAEQDGEAVVVGVNRFVADDADDHGDMEVFEVDPAVEQQRREALEALRAERDGAAVEAALDDLRAAARGDENLLPSIVEAVEAYATVGEIADAMRDVFGEHQAQAAYV